MNKNYSQVCAYYAAVMYICGRLPLPLYVDIISYVRELLWVVLAHFGVSDYVHLYPPGLIKHVSSRAYG